MDWMAASRAAMTSWERRFKVRIVGLL